MELELNWRHCEDDRRANWPAIREKDITARMKTIDKERNMKQEIGRQAAAL
jgi:hypothetical protein